ncbi:hypothetical protein VTI74DRAFT_7774 [Chaetomium olivicolor]
MAKPILVTGATGHQGGAVIDALLAADPDGTKYTILALTRDASSASATSLLSRAPHHNLKLVQGNLDDVPGVFASAKQALAASAGTGEARDVQIWGVFSVQVSLGSGVTPSREISQGMALIDGAVAHRVKHFVYSSVERGGDEVSWENETRVPHFSSKYRIERHLRDVTGVGKAGEGMHWTVLRPVAFMDNLEPGFVSRVFVAALKNYLGEREKALQWVAVADIGVFATKAFEEPERWTGRAVGLAGDELTVEGMNEAFLKVTGNPVPTTYWFFGSVLTKMVKEMGIMLEWFASDGYKVDIAELRKEHPGLMNMGEWLAKKSQFATIKREL